VAAASDTRTSAARTYAGCSPAVGPATTSTEAAAAMGSASTSAEPPAGMGTAAAKTATAVRTVVAVAVDTAEPCLDTADVVVDNRAFRVTSRSRGIVLAHHEAL
jgi:hypothetical protein